MVEVFKRNLGVISSLCISLCISPIFLGCKRLKCHKCKWRCGGCCRAAAQTCGRPDLPDLAALALLAMPGA